MSEYLTSQIGWVRLWRAENQLLNEQLGSKSASAKAVWLGLALLSNDRRIDDKEPESFTVRMALIAHVAGVAYKTTQRMVKELERLGLVETAGGNCPEGCSYRLHRLEGTLDLKTPVIKTPVSDEASDWPTGLKKKKEDKEVSSSSSSSSLSVIKSTPRGQPEGAGLTQDPNQW